MKHKYDISQMLLGIVGYKGLPFPGMFTRITKSKYPEFMKTGSRLYKKNLFGRWYFMPVAFDYVKSGTDNFDKIYKFEIPEAVISITGKKTIVETSMVGRKGTVKELININDYKISIGGFIQSTDGIYPQNGVTEIKNLYNENKALEIICGLTDLILDPEDKVVITEIGFPSTPGVEDAQAIKIECMTDKPFELIID